jgi:pyruvate,water dikinase
MAIEPRFHALGRWVRETFRPRQTLAQRYAAFRRVLDRDAHTLECLGALHEHLTGADPADAARILWLARESVSRARELVRALAPLDTPLSRGLVDALFRIAGALPPPSPWPQDPPYVLSLSEAHRFPQRCGGKAVGLSRLLSLGASVPPGVVLTAQAFGRFLTASGLDTVIARHLRVARVHDPEAVIRACAAIQEAILAADLPDAVEAAVVEAVRGLGADVLAVRSSALAEDGTDSFAGQYASEIGVPVEDLLMAIKRVYAGKYCPRAVIYRMRQGLLDMETAMAVLILPLVPAAVSGVLYTQDHHGEAPVLTVHAVRGLGARLMDGQVRPSLFVFSRSHPPRPVLFRDSDATGLDADVLGDLARMGLWVEAQWKTPLDVEWALGPQGLVLLQARPLRVPGQASCAEAPPPDAPLLAVDLDRAAPGMACGPVFRAYSGPQYQQIPSGAVVAVVSLAPALSAFMDRIGAIVAEHGSRASHLATVARERGIPVVVGIAPEALPQGMVVTVDGDRGCIWEGCVAGAAPPAEESAWSPARWEAVAARTVRLTRLDPAAPDFVPAACESVHDVVRLAHEGAVRAMLHVADRRGRGLGRARRLRVDAPFALYVLDLGAGLAAPGRGPVELAQVHSTPLRAVLDGLLAGARHWGGGVFHADWAELDRISGGIVGRESRTLGSFALVDADFAHLGLRLGYHFSRVDALASPRVEANYVRLSLEGGGGAALGQGLRQEWVRQVLEASGFTVSVRAERLEAVLARASAAATLAACRLVGRLVAALRLQDAALRSADDVTEAVRRFLAHTE